MALLPDGTRDDNPLLGEKDVENLISRMIQDLEITIDRETEFGPVDVIKVSLYWRGNLISECKETL